jgi:hypothetical protein
VTGLAVVLGLTVVVGWGVVIGVVVVVVTPPVEFNSQSVTDEALSSHLVPFHDQNQPRSSKNAPLAA